MNKQNTKITIYKKDGLGAVRKYEGKLVEMKPTYVNGSLKPSVTWMPKRSRKPFRHTQDFLIVLDGWNHPDLDFSFISKGDNIKKSRYAAFDGNYVDDFMQAFNKYIRESKVSVLMNSEYKAKCK